MKIVDTLADILNHAQKVDGFKNIKPSDFENELSHIAEHGRKSGTTTHLSTLDPHLNWKDGFFYAVTGFPGAGKSTFVSQLMINRIVKEKIKCAIYTPENYPADDYVEELLLILTGKNVSFGHKRQLTDQERQDGLNMLSKYITIIESDVTPGVNDVLRAFDILNVDKDHKMFVIDPFNSLIEGTSQNLMSEYLKIALTEFKRFAVLQNCSMVVIEHPKGTTNVVDRPEPSPMMMYGGSMWWNKTDCIFSVDRDLFDSGNPEVEIKIWKVKKQRLMGIPGSVILRYDKERGQYFNNGDIEESWQSEPNGHEKAKAPL